MFAVAEEQIAIQFLLGMRIAGVQKEIVGYVRFDNEFPHSPEKRLVPDVHAAVGGGAEKIKRIQHRAGRTIPVRATFLATAIVRVGVDEVIQTGHRFLHGGCSSLRIPVNQQCSGKPAPADPRIPVIDGLNLASGRCIPGQIVAPLGIRKAHPHEVLHKQRLEDAAL